MRKLLMLAAALATTGAFANSDKARNAWFDEARFGLFVHWGIYAMSPAAGEWAYTRADCDRAAYRERAKAFNPVKYDPAVWAKLAKAAGMKYVVFTTRHHDGFCMFDSHFTDYKITKSPYGKDAVKMLVEAFRKEGLKVGFYHSLPDWNHPGYVDPETPEAMNGKPKRPATPEEHQALKDLIYNHIHQLLTEYGKIDLLFTDYTSKYKADEDYFDRERLRKMIYECQPHILLNDRLSYFKDNVCDFDYYTPEICVPNQPQQVKGKETSWETCATMNDNWGFSDTDKNFKTVESLVAGLVGCVSQNGNLLLNVGPTALGEFPAESVERLQGLAAWFEKNGESITGCGKSKLTPPFGCAYTQKGNKLYLHFLQTPLGDVILPELKGRVRKATLLRTGEEVKCIDHWGFELLKPNEQRLRTRGVKPGDVVRILLGDPLAGGTVEPLPGYDYEKDFAKRPPKPADEAFGFVDLACKHATARVSLFGAQVVSYAPKGQENVLFAPKSLPFSGMREVHGGIPICWPSFSFDLVDPGQTQHGFARYSLFKVANRRTGDGYDEVTLVLESDEETMKLWPHAFRLEVKVQLTNRLVVTVTTHNTGKEPFQISEAMHAYFRVADVARSQIEGIETEAGRGWTERSVFKPQGGCSGSVGVWRPELVLRDLVEGRKTGICTTGNNTVVYWNAGNYGKGGKYKDNLAPDEWNKFICIEPANETGRGAVVVKPGETHELKLSIEGK